MAAYHETIIIKLYDNNMLCFFSIQFFLKSFFSVDTERKKILESLRTLGEVNFL